MVPVAVAKAPSKAKRIDRIVAVVGPNVILQSDLDRELALSPLVAERFATLQARPTPAQIEQIREELRPAVLESLIGDNLVLLEAQKYPSLALSEAELSSYLLNIAKGNQMNSIQDLRAEVESSGEYGGWEQYKQSMRRQVGVYKVEVSLVPVPEVTETEIRAKYRELGRDEDARVRVTRFVFDRQSSAQAAANALAKDAAKPPSELGEGKELEVHRGESAPAVEEALFSASQGQVVGPLAAGSQWLVYVVREVVASKLAPYAQVREQLRAQLAEGKRKRATQQYRDTLRGNHHVEIRN